MLSKRPWNWKKIPRYSHIDIDPAEIGKNIGADLPLVGDAKMVLRQMLDYLEKHPEGNADHTEWLKTHR